MLVTAMVRSQCGYKAVQFSTNVATRAASVGLTCCRCIVAATAVEEGGPAPKSVPKPGRSPSDRKKGAFGMGRA